MKQMWRWLLVIFFTTVLQASTGDGSKIGTYEQLGKTIPLDLVFQDETGMKKSLREFMDGKPTVISLNYYNCPGICGPQLDGIFIALDKMKMDETKEYKVLTLSFSPDDTPQDAANAKKNHLHMMRKDYDQRAWNFLVADKKETIDALTNALGFEYKKIINKQGYVDYVHPAGLVTISPKGKITRYLSGIKYNPFDLKMALIEASEETVRPTISKALAFCFSYDPENKKYVFATNKIVATIILSILLVLFIYLLIAGKNRNKNQRTNEKENKPNE